MWLVIHWLISETVRDLHAINESALNRTRNPTLLQPQHSYRVKITNPQRKSEVIMRQLHHFHGRFDSVITLRAKLIEEFKEQVPNSVTFNVGCFEGQSHSKVWLVTNDDLQAMYTRYPRGDITLWCDSRSEPVEHDAGASGRPAKRKRDETSTRRQDKEEEVDDVYQELRDKHADTYSTPKLRLWARMIASNLHEDRDNPPNIPAFCGSTPKRTRQQESFSDAISGAAVAIVKALGGEAPSKTSSPPVTPVQLSTAAGVSPAKSVELRMKNFEQLRYLQQLFDDGILSEGEYTEQKQSILSALRKL